MQKVRFHASRRARRLTQFAILAVFLLATFGLGRGGAQHGEVRILAPGAALAGMLCCFGRKKRHALQFVLAMSMVGMTLITGCSNTTTTTPTGTPSAPGQSTQAPSITVQPASVTVTSGQAATFSVTATGTVPLAYQWQSGGSPIAGATAATYTTPTLTLQNNGNSFAVVVTNAAGSQTSQNATVTVNAGGNNTCTAGPSIPGSPLATAISYSQIGLSWSASSAGSSCSVSYNIYRGTTSGFTPAQSNQVVFGQAGTSFADSGLTSATTYYYVVVAVDAAGISMASAQVSATTLSVSSPTQNCTTVAAPPAGLTTNAASVSSIGLAWTADTTPSGCVVTYNIYRSTTSGFTPASGNLVASGQARTSFTDSGLTSATTYYYIVEAVDAAGSSAASAQASTTTLSASTPPLTCTAAPAQPTGLEANAASVNTISLAWTAAAAPSDCTITYNVYASTASGFEPSSTNQVARGIASPLYTSTGLTASTKYFYVIEAVDGAGNSSPSAQVQDTTTAAALSEIVAINSGGPAVSNSSGGDASFVADEFFDNGGASNFGTTVSVSGTNAAPEAVYQSERNGAFNYTIPGLQPGASYTVLLHFSENFGGFNAPGKRVFSVAINGTTVLPNLDIFQVAGGLNIALVEPFTATANPQGQIVISYVRGPQDQPKSSGVEVRGIPSVCTLVPSAAPTGLTAQATSPSIINLTWQSVTPPPNCATTYNLYGSTTSGFTPSASNLIASGLTDLSYSNAGLGASNTYYYVVEAVDTDGASVPSAQANATTHPANSCISVPTVQPGGLTATGASSSAIGLSWTAITPPANCTNITYNVYGSATSGFVPSLSNEIAVNLANPVFFNTSLPASSTYYYVIQATDEDGVSSQFSSQVSAATLAPPTQLVATATSPNEIDLTFPESTLPPSVTYSIYRSTTPNFTPSGTTQVGTTLANFYNDAVVNPSTTYYYFVQANTNVPNIKPTVSGPVSATSLALGNATPFWDASNMPPTAAGAVMVVKFLNRTNGQYPDDQVFWSANINGVTVTNSIAAQPILQLPAGASSRIPIYLGTPSQNSNSYSDFLEYTLGPIKNSNPTIYSMNMDTTRVDNFGIKNSFLLTCSDGTNIAIGENAGAFAESRESTFQRYLNAVPPNFQALAQAPYRIVNPGGGGFDPGGPYVTYYNDWISQLYAANGISSTVPTGIPDGDGLGSYPVISAAIYRHVGAVAGTISTDGKTLLNAGLWGNPNLFYQTEPFSYYGKFLHQIAINGQQYTFPYDDNGDYSSDVNCDSPNTLLISIGW